MNEPVIVPVKVMVMCPVCKGWFLDNDINMFPLHEKLVWYLGEDGEKFHRRIEACEGGWIKYQKE